MPLLLASAPQASAVISCANTHAALHQFLQTKLRVAQVTRRNFEDVLPQVREALADCSFFAFDCEMTGLSETDHGSQYLDDIEERYQQACAPALGACVGNAERVRTANQPQAC